MSSVRSTAKGVTTTAHNVGHSWPVAHVGNYRLPHIDRYVPAWTAAGGYEDLVRTNMESLPTCHFKVPAPHVRVRYTVVDDDDDDDEDVLD
ncbi:hypothetical protein HDU86_008045 [Geranomyces michiganensis]|nr:hypothetical protein HDU86_008045 [Geranomyces michiganensis]